MPPERWWGRPLLVKSLADARDLLGVQTMIVGRDITGVGAFS